MGMMDFFRKMITGRPVFEEPTAVQRDNDLQPGWNENDEPGWKPETTQPPEHSPLVDDHGHKVIPQVAITHLKSHPNGERLDVTAWVQNNSELEIQVDTMEMLGLRSKIGRRMAPHKGHEATLYHGVRPTDDHNTKAKLYYKIVENGDMFEADYWIEFDRDSQGLWVEQLHAEPYVRDI